MREKVLSTMLNFEQFMGFQSCSIALLPSSVQNFKFLTSVLEFDFHIFSSKRVINTLKSKESKLLQCLAVRLFTS